MPHTHTISIAALQLEALPASSAAVAHGGLLSALQPARSRGAALAVLPAYIALTLLPALGHEQPQSWEALGAALPQIAGTLGPAWAALGATLAKECGLTLVAGSAPVVDSEGVLRHRAYVFGPHGEPLGWQDQTHLGPREQALGIVPGDALEPIATPLGPLGVLVADDVLVPEVAAILAMQGAAILVNPSATNENSEAAWQRRLWRAVQAHQCFGAEAPLTGRLCGAEFAGRATIHAPCELTADLRGALAQSASHQGEALAIAKLDEHQRQELLARFNIAAQRNDAFYASKMG